MPLEGATSSTLLRTHMNRTNQLNTPTYFFGRLMLGLTRMSSSTRGTGLMKHQRGYDSPQIKVITAPRKLAWLKAQIEKRKARAAGAVALKRSVANSQ